MNRIRLLSDEWKPNLLFRIFETRRITFLDTKYELFLKQISFEFEFSMN